MFLLGSFPMKRRPFFGAPGIGMEEGTPNKISKQLLLLLLLRMASASATAAATMLLLGL